MQPWVKNYQPGVPAQIDLPTESLSKMFEHAVAEAGDSPATEFFGRRTSYSELGRQVAQAAEGLRRLGVKAGDRVALILPNCPQHVVAFYAILRLGAVVVEHNPLYTSRELAGQFEDHRARVAIVWDKTAAAIEEFPEGIQPDHVVSVNLLDAFPAVKRLALNLPVKSLRTTKAALSAPAPGTTTWKSLLGHGPLDAGHAHPDVQDLAVIQYTSGTTGRPKGAMLSHFNLHSNALQGEAWMPGCPAAQGNLLCGPADVPRLRDDHVPDVRRAKAGTARALPEVRPGPDPGRHEESPVTIFSAVPPIYERTVLAARDKGVSLRSAKYCISGAMNLPVDVAQLWESVAGGPLVEGYGMTETSPVALGNPLHTTRKPGTIGLPFPSTLVKVVELGNPDVEVAQGEPGELLVKGPQVFMGYWNNPEETDAVLLPGGWLRTGDVVTVDADGFATIVDRAKELIITGGFNVSPTEVESVLRQHPDVKDAAVVGKPLENGGEMVVAAVELEPGATLDEAALREHCRGALAGYKVPKRIVAVDDLPRSMLGKILRKQVRDLVVPKL